MEEGLHGGANTLTALQSRSQFGLENRSDSQEPWEGVPEQVSPGDELSGAHRNCIFALYMEDCHCVFGLTEQDKG